MIKATTSLLLVAVLCGCGHIVPSHNIPTNPKYILAGVQAGDSVEVTTGDGKYREFIVVSVGASSIEAPYESIPFSDIVKLVKRSWQEPAHPCGGGMPVGCSIPEVVLILSQQYESQAAKFHPACVTHDYCYRHGFATYGVEREQCDDDFYNNMKKACGGRAGLNRLNFREFGVCQLAANQTFQAVRRYGEQHFLTTTSLHCEYQEES